MCDAFDLLWLSASHSLQRFDQPLLKYLAKFVRVAQWEYQQDKDEASCIDNAVDLLSEFVESCSGPLHLAGHGVGGAIALIFARRYPQKVRSLTLLAVATQPANTWQAHYYVQRQLFTISREQVLASNVRSLFGNQPPHITKKLVTALQRDLEQSPCQHSLFKLIHLPKGGVSMPMLVCGSKTDPVVNSPALEDWLNWLKPEDNIWQCAKGYHFFHYFYPQQVGEQILRFLLNQNTQLFAESVLSSN
ncbi:alpha/beta hydrolase [Fortiea contorta]|uniref:alpha/beta hydrolase n=1 Tax=Fortiea contorta TaxID=1892405 RepID=UPI0003468F1E|nr:alpha/beta hydrolase [Fortiea contorta]